LNPQSSSPTSTHAFSFPAPLFLYASYSVVLYTYVFLFFFVVLFSHSPTSLTSHGTQCACVLLPCSAISIRLVFPCLSVRIRFPILLRCCTFPLSYNPQLHSVFSAHAFSFPAQLFLYVSCSRATLYAYVFLFFSVVLLSRYPINRNFTRYSVHMRFPSLLRCFYTSRIPVPLCTHTFSYSSPLFYFPVILYPATSLSIQCACVLLPYSDSLFCVSRCGKFEGYRC
jgi:hypothetical protein